MAIRSPEPLHSNPPEQFIAGAVREPPVEENDIDILVDNRFRLAGHVRGSDPIRVHQPFGVDSRQVGVVLDDGDNRKTRLPHGRRHARQSVGPGYNTIRVVLIVYRWMRLGDVLFGFVFVHVIHLLRAGPGECLREHVPHFRERLDLVLDPI